jgi:hypothetical protein
MDRPVKTINEIVHGKSAITAETALQLELAMGISAALWTGLETNYRHQLARQKTLAAFEKHIDWAKLFPLKDLRQYEVVDKDVKGGALVASLLRFFGVSTINAWEQQWQSPRAAFRKSPSFTSSLPATAAWLRWGEIQASSTETLTFSRSNLIQVLVETRPCTREEPFADVIDELRDRLAGCGVAFVLTPEFEGTRVSGAARWLDADTALIQLSLRHKSDDHFWFSFFHEAAHLIEDRRIDFVDEETQGPDDDEAERRADQRARDLLIDPRSYAQFVEAGNLGADDVRQFAKRESIAPGIVVGRLQRDGLLAPNRLNNLKKRLSWSS